jgi:hypothetical protein
MDGNFKPHSKTVVLIIRTALSISFLFGAGCTSVPHRSSAESLTTQADHASYSPAAVFEPSAVALRPVGYDEQNGDQLELEQAANRWQKQMSRSYSRGAGC